MSKRNRTAVNYARHQMIDARDLLSEAIRTLESKAGPDDPNTVTITISREDAQHYAKPAAILEELQPYLIRLNAACRAALEGER